MTKLEFKGEKLEKNQFTFERLGRVDLIKSINIWLEYSTKADCI